MKNDRKEKKMEIEITRLNHTGEGIGKIENKIVFIPKTIPQDKVQIKNLQNKKNYYTALPDTYLKRGALFKEAICPYYKVCGGCQIMELPYQEQLKYKQSKVIDIFKKYADLEINPDITASPHELNYRNKITLQVEQGEIGLYQIQTKILVPIQKCYLVKEKINQVIPILKTIDLKEVTQIIIKEFQEKIMIQIKGKIEEKDAISILKNYASSIYLNNTLIYGEKKLKEVLEDKEYYISPNSFFQVNQEQTINLYNQVKKYLGRDNQNILDLYCGMASIGIFVEKTSKQITGIELNPSSIKDARENIKKNHLNNIKVKEGDVGSLLEVENTYDAIIVDPPRSGLDKKTKSGLLKIKSKTIIYVSCNPITLARDVHDLKEFYRLEEIKLFDLFPSTYHIESIALLSIHNSR